MRRIMMAALVAAGVGLFGSADAKAAPVQGSAILDAACMSDPLTQVQHWRWGSRPRHLPARSHWRWGSRGPGWGHSVRRSHWRWGSRWGRRF